jgi:hypothetical protein
MDLVTACRLCDSCTPRSPLVRVSTIENVLLLIPRAQERTPVALGLRAPRCTQCLTSTSRRYRPGSGSLARCLIPMESGSQFALDLAAVSESRLQSLGVAKVFEVACDIASDGGVVCIRYTFRTLGLDAGVG